MSAPTTPPKPSNSISKNANLSDLYQDIIKKSELKLIEWIFFGLILVGIILKATTFSLYSSNTDDMKRQGIIPVGPATGSIWGYSIILFACLGLIFIGIDANGKTSMEQIKKISYGLYALIIILLWNIILNMRFYSTINTTINMPNQYNTWNNWGLITIVMLCFFSGINYFIKKSDMGKFQSLMYQMNLYTIVVFFAAIIVVGIQQSILDNFLVAG